MSIKDRLIQFVLRGKDDLSPEARKAAQALEKVRSEGEELTRTLDGAKNAQGLANAVKTTSAEADRAKAQLEAAQKRAQDLRDALDRAPNAKGLSKALKEAEKTATAASKQLTDSEHAAEELRSELAKNPGDSGLERGLEEAEQAADEARRALQESEQQVENLRKELDQAPGTKGLEQSLRAADREAANAAKSLDRWSAEAEEAERAAAAAGIDTRNLATEQDRLAREVDEAKRAVQGNANELKTLEREQRAAARAAAEHKSRVDSVKEAMSSAGKRVLGFAAAYVSLNAALGLVQKGFNLVRDGIRSMLTVGDDFEGLQVQLNALMGSVAEGEKATAWIREFARNTPLQIDEVTQAFALLKTYGLDPMDGSLQALVDQNEKLGGGMERLSGISSALGQAWAKQKLQTEEILQLVERGVPVWEMLENVTGKNTAAIQDMVSTGELGRETIKALIDQIAASSEGAAEANMGRLSGLISNLKDTWVDFLNRVADSGALDYVKNQLQQVADTLDEWDRDGRLQMLAESLSNAFVQGAERVKAFAAQLVSVNFEDLAEKASVWLNDFGSKIDRAVEIGQTAGRIFTGVWHGFRAMVTGAATVLFTMLNMGLGNLARAAEKVADALGMDGVAEKMRFTYGLIESMQEAFSEATVDSARKVADAIEGNSQRAVNAERSAHDERVNLAKSAAEQQQMLNQAMVDHLIAGQNKAKESAEEATQAALDAALDGTRAIEDMADAMNLIDTASTVEQFERLRDAMLDAYREGRISQQEFDNGLMLINGKIKDLATEAEGAARSLDDMIEELDSLVDVQAAIKNAETDIELNKIGAAARKMYENGEISATDYKKVMEEVDKQLIKLRESTDEQRKSQDGMTDAVDETTRALMEKAAAAEAAEEEEKKAAKEQQQRAAAFGGFFGGVLTSARTSLANLSAAALDTFDKLRGISRTDVTIDTSSIEGTREALKRVNGELGELHRNMANVFRQSNPFAKWADQTLAASKQVERQFLQEKIQLQKLMESYESGRISMQGFIGSAGRLKSQLKLLDESSLGQLESAIASAKQRMDAMAQSTQATVDGLRDELDRLRGDEDAIERRRMESRRRNLELQMAEARAVGDSTALRNAREALTLFDQIERETKIANNNGQTAATAPGAAGAETPAGWAGAPSTVIRLQAPGGQAVDVATSDDAALLSVLEQSGLRSV